MMQLNLMRIYFKMIIHKIHYRYEENVYQGMVYACNWACSTTPRKYSYYWKDVTCKNCLKQNKSRQQSKQTKRGKK